MAALAAFKLPNGGWMWVHLLLRVMVLGKQLPIFGGKNMCSLLVLTDLYRFLACQIDTNPKGKGTRLEVYPDQAHTRGYELGTRFSHNLQGPQETQPFWQKGWGSPILRQTPKNCVNARPRTWQPFLAAGPVPVTTGNQRNHVKPGGRDTVYYSGNWKHRNRFLA